MTPLVAAASDTGPGTGTLLLLTAVAAVAYVIHCAIWPFRSCTRCDGAGRFRSPSGSAWRYCRACSGRGAQLRIGRRIWTHVKNTHDRDRRNRRSGR